MRKLLIVSPHFPPVNAPDMQRVRMALPHLGAQGWEATVLAVAPESIEGAVIEPLLEDTYPRGTHVMRVKGISPHIRRLGIGGLWLRCGRALARAGGALLGTKRFDLAFFSTTQFGAFTLGPRWKQRFQLPYVLDYQDPWYTDYYDRTGTRPPGGRLKFGVSQLQARRDEPRALRNAAGIISVSPAYGPMLQRFYPWFDGSRVRVLPFGVEPADFETARRNPPPRPLVPSDDGLFHHVAVGRCGPSMARALRLFFAAFAEYRREAPERAAPYRFHFIGTDYAPPDRARESVRPLAAELGVADVVHEHPARVPYFESLWYLQRADALIAVGSDDGGYSASKVFPYLLARRPTLFLYVAGSPALNFADKVNAGLRVRFGAGDDGELVRRIRREWFDNERWRAAPLAQASALDPWTAEAMTRQLAGIFDRAISD